MERVDVEGLQIAYERVGTGPALVLPHGYVGDGPTTWRPHLDGLSDEFTVIAWGAPGAGGSSDPRPLGRPMCGLRGTAPPSVLAVGIEASGGCWEGMLGVEGGEGLGRSARVL
jgi:hypothetical protein